MKVFISWSGPRSKAIAEALREWLPFVINALEPWMSAPDMEKGVRWSTEIAIQLEEASVGIICLTPESLEAPWILFEAGALSKTLEKTFVCPYLFELDPTDLKGPLVQFQATKAEREDTKELVRTLNRALGEAALPERMIEGAFDKWWPELEDRLTAIPVAGEQVELVRSQGDILVEILELVRATSRRDFRTEFDNLKVAMRDLMVRDDIALQLQDRWLAQDFELCVRMVKDVESGIVWMESNPGPAPEIESNLRAARECLSRLERAITRDDPRSLHRLAALRADLELQEADYMRAIRRANWKSNEDAAQ